MNRRDFLGLSALTALTLGTVGCGASFSDVPTGFNGGTNPPTIPKLPLPTAEPIPAFSSLNFITSDPAFNDYRPAVDATGNKVVFERTPTGGGDTKLYLAQSLSSASPSVGLFLQSSPRPPSGIPASQTRPDWNWTTGRVAMNGATSNKGTVHAAWAESDGTGHTEVPFSAGYLYPIWSSDGSKLIVYNNSAAANPRPSTSLIQPDGTVLVPNLNGEDIDGVPVFGGFAAPNPSDPTQIVFAGQPDLSGWSPTDDPNCPSTSTGYNQCYNYPFVNSFQGGVYSSTPLETTASVSSYQPNYQGRAPYWSPDGRFVLFESDRAGGYAIYLMDTVQDTPPVQVTDASWGAQHAKFFPSGDRLILTAFQQPGNSGPRGIAWVDISAFVSEG